MERASIFLLLLLSVFTLKDYVRGGAISGLGPLTITLDCSTDYAIQERSINVTYLLNSTQPNNNQVLECQAYMNCGNGTLIDKNQFCTRSQLQYGWRFDRIPLTEHFCNITISYDSNKDNENIIYFNSSICTFSDDINTTAKIQHVTENPIVGNLYEIQCIVHTNEVVNSSIVNITWIGPNNETIVTSRRTNITETSDGNNHTSILQLAYLSEKDEGLHICQVTVLNSTVFEFFKIEDLLIPAPNLNVTVLTNKKTVGSELSLGCNVTTVRGVTSNVEIVWIKDDIMMKEMSDPRINIKNYSTHSSILRFLYLSENDKSEYTCRATILNTSYSTSTQLTNFDVPTVNVSVTAVNQNLGDVLLLKCDVNVVKGITSNVYILWTNNGTNLTIYNGNVTENVTAYTYYYNGTEKLTPNDNNTLYLCQVIINNRSVGNNSVTYIVKVPATFAPVSSDTKSLNAVVISVISIATVPTLILLIIIAAFGIYVYQAKRNQKMQEVCIGHEDQTKRNNKTQEVCRDYELYTQPMPPVSIDDNYTIQYRDPSNIDYLGSHDVVNEWMEKYLETSTLNEELSSVCSPSITNEKMLECILHDSSTKELDRKLVPIQDIGYYYTSEDHSKSKNDDGYYSGNSKGSILENESYISEKAAFHNEENKKTSMSTQKEVFHLDFVIEEEETIQSSPSQGNCNVVFPNSNGYVTLESQNQSKDEHTIKPGIIMQENYSAKLSSQCALSPCTTPVEEASKNDGKSPALSKEGYFPYATPEIDPTLDPSTSSTIVEVEQMTTKSPPISDREYPPNASAMKQYDSAILVENDLDHQSCTNQVHNADPIEPMKQGPLISTDSDILSHSPSSSDVFPSSSTIMHQNECVDQSINADHLSVHHDTTI